MSTDNHIIAPEAGERFLNLGAHVNIKLSAEATGGAFAVIEHTVPPKGGPPPHSHLETELLYIISGSFEVVVGPARSEVGAGAIIYVPAGTAHTTRNIGDSAGRQLSLYLPGGAEGFFREAGTAVVSGQDIPDLDQPVSLDGVDMARILALAARYGMQVQVDPPTSQP